MISLFIEDLENLLRVKTCFGLEDHVQKLIDKWKQIEELRLKLIKEEPKSISRNPIFKKDSEHPIWKKEQEIDSREFCFVIPECEFYIEDGSCKRAMKNEKRYGCNEIWCEIKIRKKEENKVEM